MKRWMHAIKEKEPDSPGIIFIEARKAESPYRFFHRLLQQLGEEETKRQPLYEFMQTLRAAMQQSSVDLLVIDSAEHLNREMLDCLRGYLYDDWRISLLLVGQPKLLATCKRDESFQSRIGAVHSIEQFDHQPAL
jgi:DNA transposition AAA+ family ATPase